MFTTTLTIAVALCLSFSAVDCQKSPFGPKTLLEELTFEFQNGPFDGANRYTSFIASRRIVRSQTPITVRWALIFIIPFHDVRAACSPQRLSFFGTNDTIPPRLCRDPLAMQLIPTYTVNYFYRKEIPAEGFLFTQYLTSLGLTPLSKSNDLSTPNGIANMWGARIHNFFKNDGWNVAGRPKMDFGHPFYDNTGYMPRNKPGVSPKKLKYPLRWQPLTQTDMLGNFFVQRHVTPHIGLTAKPLSMPRHELLSHKTKGPYRYPNRRTIHPVDRRQIMREARRVFRLSSRLTRRQMQEAYFWDVKFYSTGLVSNYYCRQFVLQGKLPFEDVFDCIFSLTMAESLAMYDVTILAWHEKRRHDAVRPQTVIRHLFNEKTRVRAFRGFGRGKGMVKAVEWEPLIPPQPHSEYPSGSAMLCTANFEATELGIREWLKLGKNDSVPPLVLKGPHTTVPGATYLLDDVNFYFKNPKEMAYRCGISRLWAGVHFSQSIHDGFKAARGIGTAAHEFVSGLRHGKVPKFCPHCLKE